MLRVVGDLHGPAVDVAHVAPASTLAYLDEVSTPGAARLEESNFCSKLK